ncbi:MAG: acyltransferase [Clostridia bacterium]|nr:acyltransferase [Clostridia bacterium]
MSKQKEIWVDGVKIFACALVVLGHFLQSMGLSDIYSNNFTEWAIDTVYLFHVPLFFICSGYLYQKTCTVLTIKEYGRNIFKKLISLGVPYLFFSAVTWAVKNVFSDSVNIKTNGLIYSLFAEPISPYWYLYTLFFVFLITPTIKNRKSSIIILIVSLVLKCITFTPLEIDLYAVETVLEYHIWFVLGMILCSSKAVTFIGKKHIPLYFTLSAVFMISCSLMYFLKIDNGIIAFFAGIVACAATVILFAVHQGGKFAKFIKSFSEYTLPIYLMHTIFAAGIRIVLLKIGVTSGVIHTVAGLSLSFIGPIAASEILSRIKFADFVLYPGKYIKLNAEKQR